MTVDQDRAPVEHQASSLREKEREDRTEQKETDYRLRGLGGWIDDDLASIVYRERGNTIPYISSLAGSRANAAP
jgi:hypothetical protein